MSIAQALIVAVTAAIVLLFAGWGVYWIKRLKQSESKDGKAR